MQKYKQAALSIAFLTVLLSGGLTAGFVRGDSRDENANIFNQEERLLLAFENGDYDTWKKIVARKGKAYSVINKDDFQKFIAARKAVRSGEYEKAIVLAEKVEVGLKNKLGEEYFG